ncbi:MAG TPA: phage holin family protein [Burkholderiaceae bacterium]|nr:phage holin family protein [Burkholderiaceae bacterium]
MALKQSLTDTAAVLVAIVRTRIELFSLEAAEHKSQLVTLLAWLIGAGVFLLLALLVFTVAFALLVWPSDARYPALFFLAVIYLAFGLGCVWGLRRIMAQVGSPFSVTLQELKNDLTILESMRNATDHDPAGGGAHKSG